MEKLVCILAIDDEESFPFFVKHHLETITTHNFKIITANSSKEGMKPAKIYKPDLSGMEVTEELLLDDGTKSILIFLSTTLVKKMRQKMTRARWVDVNLWRNRSAGKNWSGALKSP